MQTIVTQKNNLEQLEIVYRVWYVWINIAFLVWFGLAYLMQAFERLKIFYLIFPLITTWAYLNSFFFYFFFLWHGNSNRSGKHSWQNKSRNCCLSFLTLHFHHEIIRWFNYSEPLLSRNVAIFVWYTFFSPYFQTHETIRINFEKYSIPTPSLQLNLIPELYARI